VPRGKSPRDVAKRWFARDHGLAGQMARDIF
jgi:hypothetical protein